jgi:hypothetical protein
MQTVTWEQAEVTLTVAEVIAALNLPAGVTLNSVSVDSNGNVVFNFSGAATTTGTP